MKIFKITVLVIFVFVLVAFSLTFYRVRSSLDMTVPKITIEGEEIEVNVDAADEQLLKGVTAYDEKDGDLTDKIIVQDVSKFVSDCTSIVTYVVCDSSNHLVKETRKIHYVGYESPKLVLNGPLVFPTASSVSLRSVVGATDVIDGDISSNVVINSSSVDISKDGIYSSSVSVFNSKGDRVTYDLPIRIYTVKSAPNCHIKMKKYLDYVKKGKVINPLDYVEEVTTMSGKDLDINLKAEGYVNFNVPGAYSVYFSPEDDSGYFQMTSLTVIVEE